MTVEKDVDNNQETLLSVPQPYVGKDRLEALREDEEVIQEEEVLEGDENIVPDEDLDPEEATFKKRYGDLRRHSQEQIGELQEQINTLHSQLEEATPNNWTPPKTDEELEAFATENPEAYDILVSIAEKRVQASNEDVKQVRKELEETKRQAAMERARAVIMNRHPDWDDIRASDEFHAWAEEQPKNIQDGIYANASDGELAARILDLYKMDTGVYEQKKNKNLRDAKKAAATLVDAKDMASEKSKPKPTFTRTQIASMSIHEYEANEAEILAAQREGRIENR